MNDEIIERKEIKYFINYFDYMVLKEILENNMVKDEKATNNKGFIRSLYFDTLSNKAFEEKQAGVLKRKKYRLRIYDFNSDKVKLEIKNKINEQILKETAFISKKDAIEVQNENYEVLLKYKDPVLNKIYCEFKREIYKPVVIVEYTREAFNFPLNNIRITFDKDIKVGSNNLDIFDKDILMTPSLKRGTLVLEVKYNKFLPLWVKQIIQIPRFERSAISKYCIGRVGHYI